MELLSVQLSILPAPDLSQKYVSPAVRRAIRPIRRTGRAHGRNAAPGTTRPAALMSGDGERDRHLILRCEEGSPSPRSGSGRRAMHSA